MTPYQRLENRAFWRTAVGQRNPLAIDELWSPKLPFAPGTCFATAGSCFAQNIGAALRANGLGWIDAEPAPPTMTWETRRTFGYDLFSFRTGNIYTARQLLQWLEWATGLKPLPTEVWVKDSRFYDPFRPTIEPNGFDTADDVASARATTLAAIVQGLADADVLIFTLGLTECWRNRSTGLEYPTCPGVIAGDYSPEHHVFHNQTFAEINRDMDAVRLVLDRIKPDLRLLLTVSPVPLTATASGNHVLVSTTHSKSVLRAVAGEMESVDPLCDYFPSYEIITAPPFRGYFYGPNMREVSKEGVAFVMTHFLPHVPASEGPPPPAPAPPQGSPDPICDDMMLDRYAS